MAALTRSDALVCQGPALTGADAEAEIARTISWSGSDSDSDEVVLATQEEEEVSVPVPKMQSLKWMLTGRPGKGFNYEAFCRDVREWSKCRFASLQLEKSAAGKVHIQMYLQCHKTVTAVAISKKFADQVRSWHYIKQSSHGGTNADCAAYCNKDDTRLPDCEPFQCGEMVKGQGARTELKSAVAAAAAGTRSVYELINEDERLLRLRSHLLAHARDGAALRRDAEVLEALPEAYGWQRDAVSHLLGQEDRKITWVWDPRGAAGKTQLVRTIQARVGVDNVCLLRGGKAGDLIHAWVNRGCPPYVIFDLARTRGHIAHLCGLMENLKDGNVVSTKYDGRYIPTKSVRVLVLSNSAPPSDEGRDVWTSDRYDIWTVGLGEQGVDQPDGGAAWTATERPQLHWLPVTCAVGAWYEPAFVAHS